MSSVPRDIRVPRSGAAQVAESIRQLQAVHVDTRQGRHTPWSVLLESLPHIFVPAKITQVEAPFIDGLNPLPSQVFYWAQAISNSAAKIERERPFYGQDVHNDEARVWPAQVDMDCFIVRGIDEEGARYGRLMLLPGSEVVARRPCRGGTGVPPPPPPPGGSNPFPGTLPFGPPRNTDPSTTPSAPVY